MSYQRQSEAPRKGITDQEERIAGLLTNLGISHRRSQVYCFVCRSAFSNSNPYNYPSMCINCGTVYSEKGQYAMPDFIFPGKRILNINGLVHEKDKKHINKDRYQLQELARDGYLCFILLNDEVDSMLNGTLTAYMMTIANATEATRKAMYAQEKEIACLRA